MSSRHRLCSKGKSWAADPTVPTPFLVPIYSNSNDGGSGSATHLPTQEQVCAWMGSQEGE